MSNTFKRRIYRLSLVSATSFLIGLLLYDLEDAGIATDGLIFPCSVLLFVGTLFGFKTLETWSSWDEDNSEDTDVAQTRRNAYPITFYIESALVALIVVFLLVFTTIRNRPTIQEGAILTFALLVAGACLCMGHLSSSLE